MFIQSVFSSDNREQHITTHKYEKQGNCICTNSNCVQIGDIINRNYTFVCRRMHFNGSLGAYELRGDIHIVGDANIVDNFANGAVFGTDWNIGISIL